MADNKGRDPIRFRAVVLDSGDNKALMDFYARLLGPGWIREEDEEWPALHIADMSLPWLLFQRAEDYIPPVWPDAAGKQRVMCHLDFTVDDMESAVAHAISCGAAKAPSQFYPEDACTVMLDPAGHPFCFCKSSGQGD